MFRIGREQHELIEALKWINGSESMSFRELEVLSDQILDGSANQVRFAYAVIEDMIENPDRWGKSHGSDDILIIEKVVSHFFNSLWGEKRFSESPLWYTALEKLGLRMTTLWMFHVSDVAKDFGLFKIKGFFNVETLFEEGVNRMLDIEDPSILQEFSIQIVVNLIFSKEEQENFYPDYEEEYAVIKVEK